MFHDPVEESSFKADVVPSLFALNPLMAQNLLALGQELLIKHRILYQFCGVLVRGFHVLIWEFVHLRMGVNQIQDLKMLAYLRFAIVLRLSSRLYSEVH